MSTSRLRQRHIFTLPQLIIFLAVLAALIIVVDLNRRRQSSANVGAGAAALEADVAAEVTRQVELQATLTYVESEDYVAAYARDEAGQLLPDEKRVVPLFIESAPPPPPPAPPTPDPAVNARPWQAWWRLLTDAPLPTR